MPSESWRHCAAAAAPATAFAGIDAAQRAEVADIANCFRAAESNSIPLGRVIHGVSPGTKNRIFKSGKGLEGYLRQFPSAFVVEKVGNEKMLTLVDERLREDCATVDRPVSARQIAPPNRERLEQMEAAREAALMRSRGIEPPPKQPKQQSSDEQEKPATSNAAAAEGGDSEQAAAAAAEPEAKSDETAAAADPAAAPVATTTKKEDAGDKNPELTHRVKACLPGENQWYRVSAIHYSLYRGTTVQIAPFVAFLRNAPKHFWIDEAGDFACRRLPYHTAAPPNLNRFVTQSPRANLRGTAPRKPGEDRFRGETPQQVQERHEWGDAKNAPTTQDVYEILRYIPIHWTEFGGLQIPDVVRKKHIRIASKLTWFARQPRFFDLRWIGGTCEIRRAPVLHPAEHNLTKEEAEKLLQARIEEDARFGQPLVLLQARGVSVGMATSVTARQMQQPITSATTTAAAAPKREEPQQRDGGAAGTENVSAQDAASSVTPPSPPPSAAPATSKQPHTLGATAAAGSSSSANVEAVQKALVRIAPGYFVPAESIMRRATKKMTDDDLVLATEKLPLMVERLYVRSKTNPQHTLSLYRRKMGVDESTWRPAFVEELENSPNLPLLGTLMTHLCAQWDRTHFLYVRLPDSAKIATGGFDDMVAFLRQHPQCFRVGEFFIKRNDLSDPVGADADAEPTSKVVTTTKQLEDNPYHQLIDLATVFHYLTPENDAVSLSHFVDASSPAMRSVLPPRILTILQAYPEMFACREVAPGSFAVSRAKTSADAEHEAALSSLTKDEAVQQLVAIIPPRGVDIAHLESTMPQQLRRAIVRLFGSGGVMALVHEYAGRFHLVKNPPYTTVFVRRQG